MEANLMSDPIRNENDIRGFQSLDIDGVRKRLIAWLVGDNARRRNLAVEFMKQMESVGVHWIVCEALKPRLDMRIRARLLEAIKAIGLPLDDYDHQLIMAMIAGHGVTVVHRELLAKLNDQHGLGKNPPQPVY
jgi:hypothetical protein